MKALVVFDSVAGNTEKIAEAVAAGIAADTKAVRIGSSEATKLEKVTLLVVGSPTFGGRPTEAMQKYVDSVAPASRNLAVAAFDTRLRTKLVKVFGYSADKIAARFKEMGSKVEEKPEGFIVNGRTGPLADGELERAALWGKDLRRKYSGA